MEKEITEVTAVEAPASHNEIIDSAIKKIENNDFKIYYYSPSMNSPSGGVGVLLKSAKLLKDNGFNAKIVYEPMIDEKASYEESVKQKKEVHVYQKFNPTWLDFSMEGVDFIPLGDKDIFIVGEKNEKGDYKPFKCEPLNVNPEDFLIIPEGFPNVMQKTMQVSCKRIVFAQSWFYVLLAMRPAEKWQHFGIYDAISVSDAITEYLNSVMPGLKIKNFKQGINRKIFKVPPKMSDKLPIVGFTGSRGSENKMKTHSIIRNFYAFYPHLKWIRFVELANMDREQFAERLASCAFLLYTDDIAGFGTLPLEAMACGTHVVGWAAFGGKEYISNENGFWTNNGDIFQTAETLGVAIDKWLAGELDHEDVQKSYEKTLTPYAEENEKNEFLNIINQYKNERINELEGIKTK
jgi:glycosyltransferase involved in cell wall biosynthesis